MCVCGWVGGGVGFGIVLGMGGEGREQIVPERKEEGSPLC
jgi:hypothetical protein